MSEQQLNLPGPVFEAGPGWGAKIKQWLVANFGRRILPILAIAVLLTGIATFQRRPDRPVRRPESLGQPFGNFEVAQIGIVVKKGDGVITASRRAVEQYLENHPEIILSAVQRLQVDNFFKERYAGQTLTAKEEIFFSERDIEQAIKEAGDLSSQQVEVLKTYLP